MTSAATLYGAITRTFFARLNAIGWRDVHTGIQ